MPTLVSFDPFGIVCLILETVLQGDIEEGTDALLGDTACGGSGCMLVIIRNPHDANDTFETCAVECAPECDVLSPAPALARPRSPSRSSGLVGPPCCEPCGVDDHRGGSASVCHHSAAACLRDRAPVKPFREVVRQSAQFGRATHRDTISRAHQIGVMARSADHALHTEPRARRCSSLSRKHAAL
jgi:hypothetical protein